jgi:hypothetical protein
MRTKNVSINVADCLVQDMLVSFAVALGNFNAATGVVRIPEEYVYAVR